MKHNQLEKKMATEIFTDTRQVNNRNNKKKTEKCISLE